MTVLAAEGASPVAVQILPLVTTIVVFLVAFFILATKVWPRILGGLADRERKIREEIRAAEESRAKAEKAQRDFEQALASARHEAAEMIKKAKDDARVAADDLRARNEAELAEMKRRASSDIEAAKHAAISELHAEATMLAAAMASKILAREVSASDQQRLVEESLAELGRGR